MKFVSLGMLTLDDLIFSQSNQKQSDHYNTLGGAGTYAVLGARIIAGPTDSNSIGWVVHEGTDFPVSAKSEVDSWKIRTRYIRTPNRLTTKGRNVYVGEDRTFNFETPKMQVTPYMLDSDQLQAKSFHIIGTPARCIDLVQSTMELRKAQPQGNNSRDRPPRPIFVWEPMEHSCCPDALDDFEATMELVDVFSPNELEFAKLVGFDLQAGQHLPLQTMQEYSYRFIENCRLQSVVVRLGGNGAFVASRDPTLHYRTLPAYYRPGTDISTQAVVDVTGGGNAFLGAFSYVLASDQDFSEWNLPSFLNRQEIAALAGAVAASFTIEQFGMPKLEERENIGETWGRKGGAVSSRMQVFSAELRSAPDDKANNQS